MTNSNATLANDTAHPKVTSPQLSRRFTKPLPVFSKSNWLEVHDALQLALDALCDGPETAQRAYCYQNLNHAATVLKRAQSRERKHEARGVA